MSSNPQNAHTIENLYDATDLITQEVLARYEKTPDPRLRQIMLSLIKHIHGFAKEVKLTSEEWHFAIQYLEESGKWCMPGRSEFMIFSDALGLSMLTVTQDYPKPAHATEATLVGPFLLENAPKFAMGTDISGGAAGTPMHAQGVIRDTEGQPVAHTVIDVWHSDDRGLYDVQDDLEKNGAWARAELTTDADGRYHFWSVLPVDYPIPQDGTAIRMLRATTNRTMRPAHLHFRLQAPGHRTLVTHIFDKNSEHLNSDAVFGVRPSLIADFVHHDAGIAPDGKKMDSEFYTLDYDFVMTR
jgi:hydroxyquinol 1,2-dioxygenase